MQRVQAVSQGFVLLLAERWWEVGGLRMKRPHLLQLTPWPGSKLFTLFWFFSQYKECKTSTGSWKGLASTWRSPHQQYSGLCRAPDFSGTLMPVPRFLQLWQTSAGPRVRRAAPSKQTSGSTREDMVLQQQHLQHCLPLALFWLHLPQSVLAPTKWAGDVLINQPANRT